MTAFPSYCPRCGSELERRRIEGRERAYCTRCTEPVYRNAKPCAGVIVVDGVRALLVERTNPPAVGSWSLPAGFLEVDEPPEAAAARELAEETGVSVQTADLELFDTNLVAHDDGTRVLVTIYRTTRDVVTGTVVAGSDAADARFWNVDELLERNESIEMGYEPIVRRAIAEE
ncbi:NUDIX domain-containing protein [Halorubrum sp. CBA1125]|nr:NUDIX domain-containing protein [Halorubrum sp. CBA1125]